MDHKCSPKEVVNQILDRPLEWIEWRLLPEDARKQWSNDAEILLNNKVFQALCGKSKMVNRGIETNGEYVKMCIEEIARRSNSQEETEKARMLIVALERLREMVQEMILVDNKSTTEDINSAI